MKIQFVILLGFKELEFFAASEFFANPLAMY